MTIAPPDHTAPAASRARGLSARLGRHWRRVLATVAVVAAASAGVVVAPMAASAAELDAVTAVSITNPPPLVTMRDYTFNATWAVPDTAVAGDTFSLSFPAAVTAYASAFDLRDSGGNLVGTCAVSTSNFLCTLTDYVDTHDNVHGTLNFTARFTEQVTEQQITFTTGSQTPIVVPIPGGVGDGGTPLPTSVIKYGYMNADGRTMSWDIVMPSSALAPSTGDVLVTDDYDDVFDLSTASVVVQWMPTTSWPDSSAYQRLSQGAGPDTYTYTPRASDGQFDVTLHDPVTDGSRLYDIYVTMDLPANVQNGDTFTNRVFGVGYDVTANPVTYVTSGGTGTGDNLGDVDITKTTTGTGAADVTGATYTVNYSYQRAGAPVTGSLSIVNGQTQPLNDLPEGAVLTMSETAASAAGVTYGTPVFSGPGVTDNGDGTASVTVIDGTIAVGLQNPVSLNVGSLSVTKSVTGTGATAASVTDAEYTVDYSYTVAGAPVTGSMQLAAGETDGLSDLRQGTVVTLSELAATGDGVTYGTPVYSGAGVVDNQDGTASVTIGAGTVAIALQNPVALVPAVPDVPAVPGTPVVPAVPATPVTSPAPASVLASTGGELSVAASLVAAGGLLLGGIALLVARRRRRVTQ